MRFLLVLLLACSPAKGPTAECVITAQSRRDSELARREDEFIRKHPSSISREDAIAIAERFVRDEGFTTAPPKVRSGEEHREFMEPFSYEETMANRFDSVVPEAVGAIRRPRYWMVAFPKSARSRQQYPGLAEGRGIGVSIDGRHAFIQHQDIGCLALYAD